MPITSKRHKPDGPQSQKPDDSQSHKPDDSKSHKPDDRRTTDAPMHPINKALDGRPLTEYVSHMKRAVVADATGTYRAGEIA